MSRSEGRRARRRFTFEGKAGAVRLVLDEGKSAGGWIGCAIVQGVASIAAYLVNNRPSYGFCYSAT